MSPAAMQKEGSGNTKTEEEIAEDGNDEHVLNEAVDKYAAGLTIHGLSNILLGRWQEQMFWVMVVTGAVAILGYGMDSLIRKYRSYDVNQSHMLVRPVSMSLPSITMCLNEVINNNFKCYNGLNSKYPDLRCYIATTAPTLDLISCTRHPYIYTRQWPNCTRTEQPNITPNGECYTLNPSQAQFQGRPGETGRVMYLLKYHPPPLNSAEYMTMQILLHEADESPFIMPRPHHIINIKYDHVYTIQIEEKTTYDSLAAPYQLNGLTCFPGKSPIFSLTEEEQFPCVKTCLVNKQVRVCGDVNELWKRYSSDELRAIYPTNKSIEEIRHCISHGLEEHFLDWKPCPDCPEPCKRTDYRTTGINVAPIAYQSFFGYKANEQMFAVEVFYTRLQYTVVSETPTYPWFSFLAEFGGFLGLLTGCSAISVIEIAVLIVLAMVKWYKSHRKPERGPTNPSKLQRTIVPITVQPHDYNKRPPGEIPVND